MKPSIKKQILYASVHTKMSKIGKSGETENTSVAASTWLEEREDLGSNAWEVGVPFWDSENVEIDHGDRCNPVNNPELTELYAHAKNRKHNKKVLSSVCEIFLPKHRTWSWSIV